MTNITEIRPNLQALINMAIGQLNAISEAVPHTDKVTSLKVAKHAKQCRGLIDLIRQEINDIREAHKASAPKKGK